MLACAESNFSNFKFEYLRENEFLRKSILACLSGAQMGSINAKKLKSKISWHCPFKYVKNLSIYYNLMLINSLQIAMYVFLGEDIVFLQKYGNTL